MCGREIATEDHEVRGPGAVLPRALRRRLARRYDDPPRHYHSFAHAAAVAERVAELGGSRATLLAAWFHDVVHDPRAVDNEERSAALAEEWLAGDPDAAEVARLVRTTRDHDPRESDVEAAVLCDADLAVLGGPPPAYEDYRRAVRAEYGHLDDASWRRGRAAVLTSFLDRDRIFRTPTGQERWESAARQNLHAELSVLNR